MTKSMSTIVQEMFFDDGASPPKEIIAQWRDVVLSTFDPSTKPDDDDMPCIAVHCIAGLGRYDLSTFSTLFRGRSYAKIAPLVLLATLNTIKNIPEFYCFIFPIFSTEQLQHCLFFKEHLSSLQLRWWNVEWMPSLPSLKFVAKGT